VFSFFFFGGAFRLATINRVSLASQLNGKYFHPAFTLRPRNAFKHTLLK